MNKIDQDPVKLLERCYSERRAKNPAYSLRAFAKYLNMSPARLSQVMSRARPITKGQIEKISIAQSLSPKEKAQLLASIDRAPIQSASQGNFKSLDEHAYKVISDVNASSILAAMPLCGDATSVQISFFAKKLGLSVIEVRRIIDDLVSAGLVQIHHGSYVPTNAEIASPSTVKSAARRKYHKAIIEKAKDSIESQSLDERDLSSVTFVLDPKILPIAKQKIQEFRRELSNLMEKSGNPSEVYALNIQLFKLSK